MLQKNAGSVAALDLKYEFWGVWQKVIANRRRPVDCASHFT